MKLPLANTELKKMKNLNLINYRKLNHKSYNKNKKFAYMEYIDVAFQNYTSKEGCKMNWMKFLHGIIECITFLFHIFNRFFIDFCWICWTNVGSLMILKAGSKLKINIQNIYFRYILVLKFTNGFPMLCSTNLSEFQLQIV